MSVFCPAPSSSEEEDDVDTALEGGEYLDSRLCRHTRRERAGRQAAGSCNAPMVEDVQEVRGRACINGQKESPETTRVSASVFRSLHAPACVRGGLTDHYHQPPLTARLARDAGGVAPPPPPAAAELKPEYEEADTSLLAYRPPPPPPPPPVVSSVSVARGAGEGGRDCEEEGQVAGRVMTWRASESVPSFGRAEATWKV